MINNSPILTLQGRVTQNTLKKLKVRTYATSAKRGWFFADYSMQEIPTKTSFDIFLQGENKRLLHSNGTVKIVSAIDQFGHKLPTIPEGFKTICRLEFHPDIPASVKKLPLMNEWKHNAQSITLAQHEGTERYILAPKQKETVEQQIERQQKKLNHTNFLSEIVGKWPGDESVEEILNALNE